MVHFVDGVEYIVVAGGEYLRGVVDRVEHGRKPSKEIVRQSIDDDVVDTVVAVGVVDLDRRVEIYLVEPVDVVVSRIAGIQPQVVIEHDVRVLWHIVLHPVPNLLQVDHRVAILCDLEVLLPLGSGVHDEGEGDAQGNQGTSGVTDSLEPKLENRASTKRLRTSEQIARHAREQQGGEGDQLDGVGLRHITTLEQQGELDGVPERKRPSTLEAEPWKDHGYASQENPVVLAHPERHEVVGLSTLCQRRSATGAPEHLPDQRVQEADVTGSGKELALECGVEQVEATEGGVADQECGQIRASPTLGQILPEHPEDDRKRDATGLLAEG